MNRTTYRMSLFKTVLRDRGVLIIALISFGLSAYYPSNALSQPLESLTKSEEYWAIQSDQIGPHVNRRQKQGGFLTPYESLFVDKKGPANLLNWLGYRLASWKMMSTTASLNKEVAYAEVTYTDKMRIRIHLLVLVPKPELQLLAKNSVLMSFKRLQPPFVDVTAGHTIEIHGVKSNYSRLGDGSCTLQVPIEKNGLVQLQTNKCTDSAAMIAIAKSLTFNRLNGKLAQ